MTNKPNTVLVASTVNKTGTNLTAGQLVFINGKTGTVVADTYVADLEKLQLGVVVSPAITSGAVSDQRPAYIAKTKAFKKSELKSLLHTEFSAATEDTYTLTVPAIPAGSVYGDNMHVRLTFKHAGNNFAKADEYAFAVKSYANNNDLAADIAKRINANIDSWATATVSTNVVTITAKVAIDHQPNAKTMNPTMKYNQVEFDLASYIVNGTNDPVSYGTIVHTVVSNPGFGNPYVIRDQERDAFGYAGAMATNVYPNLQPTPTVNLQGRYNSVTIEMSLDYMAPDESYMKTTSMVANIYVALGSVDVYNAVAGFAGMELLL